MESVSLKRFIKYLPNQEFIPCCTSSAVLLASEILLAQNNQYKHFSRLFLYYVTRKLQSRIGQRGASIEHTLIALHTFGVCEDEIWPFIPARVNKEPDLSIYERAKPMSLVYYESANLSEFKNYLRKGYPIIIGLNTGIDFWKLSGGLSDQNYTPVSQNNKYSTGHAVIIIGFDDSLNNGSWIIANSLGLSWGDRGFGAIPYACNTDIGEAFVITRFVNSAPNENFNN